MFNKFLFSKISLDQYIKENSITTYIITTTLGVCFMTLLAQVKIPLWWTPVPITGQTFGVAFLSLLLGRNKAFVSIISYLTLGIIGAPVFASWSSGLQLGPSFGYLIGMIPATFLVGSLSDKGWSKSWPLGFLSAASGSFLIFTFGLIGLSFFVPKESLLLAGVLPFLPGDITKNLIASFLVSKLKK